MVKRNKSLTELVHDMRDEGDLHNPPRPTVTWHLIVCVLLVLAVVYALITAALVLIG